MQEADARARLCPASGSQWRAFWEVLRTQASGHSNALSLSGSRFVDTSALIRLPDDCTVGYIIECKLGGHLQSSHLFHSHLETLQLLGAAQLLTQVSWPPGRRQWGRCLGLGKLLLMGKLRPRVAKDPLRAYSDFPPPTLKG